MTIIEARRQWAEKKLSQCTEPELEVVKLFLLEDTDLTLEQAEGLCKIAGIKAAKDIIDALKHKGILFRMREWEHPPENYTLSFGSYTMINFYRRYLFNSA